MAKILIIEDNHVNLEMITFLLKSFGHTTLVAKEAMSGLQAAADENPDLILCDIQLPGKDGYYVIKELKSDHILCKIPVIAVSSYAMVGDKEKALAGGFDSYISKPIDPSSFVQEINQCLRV